MIVPILQVMQAKGAGEATVRRFLSYALSHGESTASGLLTSPRLIEEELGVRSGVAENILSARSAAQRLAGALEASSTEVVWCGSHAYPGRLRTVLGKDAPAVLFLRGNRALASAPGVGFCGSRRASEKGLEITARCAAILAVEGICVVSGYAHGVDFSAHRSALENRGSTTFVLAEGILRCRHKRGILEMLTAENHLVVSQFPPELTWSAPSAMRRNSLIIGLSDAMVLVESGLTGGTHAAGEDALRRQHPLFVIDFAEPASSAEANPDFIRRGGVPIRGYRDGTPNLERLKAAVSKGRGRQEPVDRSVGR